MFIGKTIVAAQYGTDDFLLSRQEAKDLVERDGLPFAGFLGDTLQVPTRLSKNMLSGGEFYLENQGVFLPTSTTMTLVSEGLGTGYIIQLTGVTASREGQKVRTALEFDSGSVYEIVASRQCGSRPSRSSRRFRGRY